MKTLTLNLHDVLKIVLKNAKLLCKCKQDPNIIQGMYALKIDCLIWLSQTQISFKLIEIFQQQNNDNTTKYFG